MAPRFENKNPFYVLLSKRTVCPVNVPDFPDCDWLPVTNHRITIKLYTECHIRAA